MTSFRHFVWNTDIKKPACQTCEIVKPKPQAETAPRPQTEKFSVKFGKIKVEVKHAKEVEVHENKHDNILTLKIK